MIAVIAGTFLALAFLAVDYANHWMALGTVFGL